MTERYIPLEYEEVSKISIEDVEAGYVYRSTSGPKSMCLKLDDESSVLLTDDAGRLRVRRIERPSKAAEILGKLVGVTVRT